MHVKKANIKKGAVLDSPCGWGQREKVEQTVEKEWGREE